MGDLYERIVWKLGENWICMEESDEITYAIGEGWAHTKDTSFC